MSDVPHYYGIDPGSDEWDDVEWFRFLTGISDIEHGGFKDCSPISKIALYKDLYKKVLKLSSGKDAKLFDTHCEAMGRLDYCYWYEMVPLERPVDHMDPGDITSFIHGAVTEWDNKHQTPIAFKLTFGTPNLGYPDIGYPDIGKDAIMDLLADDLKDGKATADLYDQYTLHNLQAKHLADCSYAAQVCKEYIGRIRKAWLKREEGHLRLRLHDIEQNIVRMQRDYNDLVRKLEKRQ